MPLATAKREIRAAPRVAAYRMSASTTEEAANGSGGWLEATPIGHIVRGAPIPDDDSGGLLSAARRWINGAAMSGGMGLLGVFALESVVPGGVMLVLRPSGDRCPTFVCIHPVAATDPSSSSSLSFRFQTAFEWKS